MFRSCWRLRRPGSREVATAAGWWLHLRGEGGGMSIFRSENLRNGPKERESRLSSARPMMEPKKKPSPRCRRKGLAGLVVVSVALPVHPLCVCGCVRACVRSGFRKTVGSTGVSNTVPIPSRPDAAVAAMRSLRLYRRFGSIRSASWILPAPLRASSEED